MNFIFIFVLAFILVLTFILGAYFGLEIVKMIGIDELLAREEKEPREPINEPQFEAQYRENLKEIRKQELEREQGLENIMNYDGSPQED